MIMKYLLLLVLCLVSGISYATTSATYVPNFKTGGSSPSLQNGNIVDTSTSSVSGNVGVGTINPNSMLDVEGTVTSATFFAATPVSGTNQNVGIGSFSPGTKLDVNGSIRATGFVVGISSGVTNTATTTCGCKIYKGGVCMQLGTCS